MFEIFEDSLYKISKERKIFNKVNELFYLNLYLVLLSLSQSKLKELNIFNNKIKYY